VLARGILFLTRHTYIALAHVHIRPVRRFRRLFMPPVITHVLLLAMHYSHVRNALGILPVVDNMNAIVREDLIHQPALILAFKHQT
jgi:hypothetical protein